MSEKCVRVKRWEDFKRLAIELKPDAIVYSIDQNGLSKTKELTCLRLILSARNGYYVYLDFPKGNMLRETGIPIHEDKRGNRCPYDEDVVQFIKDALGRENQYSRSGQPKHASCLAGNFSRGKYFLVLSPSLTSEGIRETSMRESDRLGNRGAREVGLECPFEITGLMLQRKRRSST